jgi:hypothetical protein
MPQPEIPHLRLMADLQMDPRDRSIRPDAVVRVLSGIDGSWLQLRDHSNAPVQLSPPGHLWPYFGRGNYLSRGVILAALDESLRQAAENLHDPVEFFVFYVAAHGRLDDDGSPYVLTANDHFDGPEKLYYSDVLEAVGRVKPRPDRRLVRIVVFDACQEPATPASKRAPGAQAPAIPPDTILVSSTSPGAYAWQLPSTIREHSESERKGLGTFSRVEKRAFDAEFSAYASAFPMAGHNSVAAVPRSSGSLTLQDWLIGLERSLPGLFPSAGKAASQTVVWLPREQSVTSPIIFERISVQTREQ